MRKKLLALGVVVVIVVSAAGLAFADAWGWGKGLLGPSRPEDVLARIEAVRNLGLTDEQVDSIQGILQDSYSTTKQLQDQMWQLTFELRSLYWQKDPDQAAIEAKIEAINSLKQQMKEESSTSERIRSVLTQEQQESWSAANAKQPERDGLRQPGRRHRSPLDSDGGTAAPSRDKTK